MWWEYDHQRGESCIRGSKLGTNNDSSFMGGDSWVFQDAGCVCSIDDVTVQMNEA